MYDDVDDDIDHDIDDGSDDDDFDNEDDIDEYRTLMARQVLTCWSLPWRASLTSNSTGFRPEVRIVDNQDN